jgi:bilin biosynthesis PecF protein
MISLQPDITLEQLTFLSVESLIEAYHTCPNQNIQARIISILAELGDDRALDLLVEVVGVEVANHCQGNVRRVAARGLEQMVIATTDPEKSQRAIYKLSWALLNAEDWALRYAAAVSLGGIATVEINTILDQAMTQESDRVVKERIRIILNV